MKFSLFSCALTLLLVAALAAANVVVDLTDTKKFDVSVGRDRPALVEFYAPWCGHCKKLEPEYAKAAAAFKDEPGKVLIAKVNADQNKELSRRFGVKGYPTIKYFPFNSLEAEDYNGPRDSASIVDFINQKAAEAHGKAKGPAPAAAEQLNAANFDDIVMDENKNVLVEFYAPWCGHCKNLAPTYNKVAGTYENDDDCVIAQMDADNVDNRPFAQRYDVQSFPTIKFFPKGSKDKKPVDYTGGRTETNFISWINQHCGVHRIPGGGLNDLAGRLPSLDSLAGRFFSAASDVSERVNVLGEARAFVNSVKGGANATEEKNKVAQYYLRIMDKTMDDPNYVERETERLGKIMAKHVAGTSQLASKKVDDLKRRLNVLSAFTKRQLTDRAKDAKAKAEKIKDEL